MAHPQIIRARIEGEEFTLYYDYDQLEHQRLAKLTDGGKIEWFRLRMQFVFLQPLDRLYKVKSPAFRELNSTKASDHPHRSFVIASFSLLLNGVEALGSFLTPPNTNNWERFHRFIELYMKPWDVTVTKSPMGATKGMKTILWTHFRNGIAHGFCIDRGGIDNEADCSRWRVLCDEQGKPARLEIGPNAFYRDFRAGVDKFFDDMKNRKRCRQVFLARFREVYPT